MFVLGLITIGYPVLVVGNVFVPLLKFHY